MGRGPGRRLRLRHDGAPLDRARAGGRGGGDHRLELPPRAEPQEGGLGAGRRLHRGAEGRPGDAVVRAPARPPDPREHGLPAGRDQRDHVVAERHRRADHRRPARRHDLVHRLDGRGPQDSRSHGASREAHGARARRQVGARADGRPARDRDPGDRGPGGVHDLLPLGPGLRAPLPHPGAEAAPRGVRRGAESSDGERRGRRPHRPADRAGPAVQRGATRARAGADPEGDRRRLEARVRRRPARAPAEGLLRGAHRLHRRTPATRWRSRSSSARCSA